MYRDRNGKSAFVILLSIANSDHTRILLIFIYSFLCTILLWIDSRTARVVSLIAPLL